MMLAGGLLALAGCGGGTRVVTRTVTGSSSTPTTVPQPHGTQASSAPSKAALAAAHTFAGSALAATAEQAALPVGDAVYAAAAGAAADHLVNQPVTASGLGLNSSGAHGPTRTRNEAVSGQGSGQFAVAYTNGNFEHPSAIVLHVDATPAQSGSVDWNVVCYELSGGVGLKQGRAILSLPTTKTLALPAPSRSCSASANVQLSKTGSVTIAISG